MHACLHRKILFVFAFYLPAQICFADDLESRLSLLQTQMADLKTETVHKTSGVQFAPGGPQYDGDGIHVRAAILFWHLNAGGSDIAVSLKGPADRVDKIHSAHFDWDFGYQAGIGYTFEHDAWDVLLNFTWFQTTASTTAHGGLSPQKGVPFTIHAAAIHCNWHVHYNVLDLELGRCFFVSKYLSVRPQFGIETSWIDQRRNLAVHRHGQARIRRAHIHGKNSFWGIGPRAGVNGTWYFGRHFSTLGVISSSLQWGDFDVRTKESIVKNPAKKRQIKVDGNFHTLVPNAEMKLGIGWDANILEGKNHVGVSLFYEFQYWWRQNQFINEPFKTVSFQHESEDLAIQGLTLDFRFDF